MKKFALFISVLFVLTGCATGSSPSPKQLATEHFAECPADYEQIIERSLKMNLFDPFSAVVACTEPEKYVYEGQFGHIIYAGINAKNRYGAYTGIKYHHYFCKPNGMIEEVHAAKNAILEGLSR